MSKHVSVMPERVVMNARRRALAAIIASISAVGLALGLTLPLISLVLERQGYDSSLIGLVGAMPAVGILIGAPLTPWLVRRIGTRPALLWALAFNIATILPMAWIESYALWLLLRFVMGAADAVLFTISETWVNQLAEEHNRGRLVAIYITVLSSFFASGPLLIGLTGSEGPLPFLVACGVLLLAAPPLLGARAEVMVVGGPQAAFSVAGFMRLAPALAFGVLLFASIDGSTMALLPLFGLRVGYSEAVAAAMITVLIAGNIALQVPIGWLADRMNRERLLAGCGAGVGLGALLLMATAGSPLMWPTLLLLGTAAGGVYTLAMVIVGQRFRGADLVTANAAFGVLWGLGTLLGPLAAGLLMRWVDPGGLPLTWALLAGCFLALFAYFRVPKRRSR